MNYIVSIILINFLDILDGFFYLFHMNNEIEAYKNKNSKNRKNMKNILIMYYFHNKLEIECLSFKKFFLFSLLCL